MAEREGLTALHFIPLRLCEMRWRGGNDFIANAHSAVKPGASQEFSSLPLPLGSYRDPQSSIQYLTQSAMAEREGLTTLHFIPLRLCGMRWRGGNDFFANAHSAVKPGASQEFSSLPLPLGLYRDPQSSVTGPPTLE